MGLLFGLLFCFSWFLSHSIASAEILSSPQSNKRSKLFFPSSLPFSKYTFFAFSNACLHIGSSLCALQTNIDNVKIIIKIVFFLVLFFYLLSFQFFKAVTNSYIFLILQRKPIIIFCLVFIIFVIWISYQ